MNARTSINLALIMACAFLVGSLMVVKPGHSEVPDGDDSVQIAIYFIKYSPTYEYDGMDGTLRVVEHRILESYPVQNVIIMTFDSSHAGFGDRTGQVLAQLITRHRVSVTVVEGKVVHAVIDEVWDELNQREVGSSDEEPTDTIISTESAVTTAVGFLLRTHDGLSEVAVVSNYDMEDLTPEGHMGSSTQRFTGAGWNITVSWQVVRYPVYNVEAEYEGAVSFLWEGTVDHTGEVEEIRFEVSQ